MDVPLDFHKSERLLLAQANDRCVDLYKVEAQNAGVASSLRFIARSEVTKVGSLVLQASFVQDWRKHAAVYELTNE